ncbi:leucine-rich repeat-containing protein 72 [Megalops cyprinoides]|uniref:leucine-rich repeat-containing protein 72 n=1 Tax=Megalops cyprinoides TaxID=118141 RepID=UPI001863CF76|nr:leucine-rich repeat-containing protein 72 [Megalops cyprinoides]
METDGKEINDILRRHGLKRNIDVIQLYLGKKGIVYVPDLSQFPMLRYLWLNDNKIKKISCQTINCCLTELHLHNNEITSISGALSHLTCLQVLLLHNNQLRRLDESVTELRRMQCLHTTSFFLNPLTHDPQYRPYIIHHLPSVQILDRREVKQKERDTAFRLFNPERHRVSQSLAFGRRAEPVNTQQEVSCDALVPIFHQCYTTEPCSVPRGAEQPVTRDVLSQSEIQQTRELFCADHSSSGGLLSRWCVGIWGQHCFQT